MSKKQFKKYINENGFFVNFNVNKIDRDDIDSVLENWIKIDREIPVGKNIIIFKGIASQNYGLGEKSRNWYKIDQKGWMFENYLKNPIVLLQHNHDYGGIGHASKLWLDKKEWNLNILLFVDTNTLDDKTKYQIENGYITAVSTSHYTHEDKIEDNKTGKRMTREEAAEKLDREELRNVMIGNSDKYTLVVTKAEMIENSMVTIGSNEGALVSHNSVGNYFTNKYSETLFSGILSNKFTGMNPEEIKALLDNAGLSKDQRNKVMAKLNELKDEEKTDEKVDEVVSEVAKEDENKEEKTDEKTDENKEEKKEEAGEDEAKSGEKPSTSENDEAKEDGENPEKNNIRTNNNSTFISKIEFNKFKEASDNAYADLKKELNAQAKESENLIDWLVTIVKAVNTMQDNLRAIVTDGVSNFAKVKEDTADKKTQLTTLLENIAG